MKTVGYISAYLKLSFTENKERLSAIVKTVLAYLILLSGYFALMYLASYFFSGTVRLIADIAVKIFVCVLCAVTAGKLLGSHLPDISVTRFLKATFIVGAMMWLYIYNNLTVAAVPIDKGISYGQALRIVFVYAIYAMGIGLAEEGLHRRLLLDSLALRMPKWVALIISSVCFSLSHIINFFSQPNLFWYTIAQLVYAFIIGLFLGAVYLRSRSYLAVVVLHAMFDFVALAWEGLSTKAVEAASTDITAVGMIVTVHIYIPLLFAAIFIARKSKLDETDELWQK